MTSLDEKVNETCNRFFNDLQTIEDNAKNWTLVKDSIVRQFNFDLYVAYQNWQEAWMAKILEEDEQ